MHSDSTPAHGARGQTRACQTCGAPFYRPPSRCTPDARFCSKKCRVGLARPNLRSYYRKHGSPLKGKSAVWLKKPPVELTCAHCRKVVTLSGRAGKDARRGVQRFCSPPCAYAWIREHPEWNPRFRGGHAQDYGRNWSSQASATRKRDGYRCADCKLEQRRPALDVHHRVPLRKFNGDFDLANDLGNLVTLCRSCHGRWERAMTSLYAPWE